MRPASAQELPRREFTGHGWVHGGGPRPSRTGLDRGQCQTGAYQSIGASSGVTLSGLGSWFSPWLSTFPAPMHAGTEKALLGLSLDTDLIAKIGGHGHTVGVLRQMSRDQLAKHYAPGET